MKKAIAWILRILCVLVIAGAAVTLIRCILDMDADYSYEAVMGHARDAETAAVEETPSPEPASTLEAPVEELPAERPIVALSAEGSFSGDGDTVRVTATFSNIQNSVKADLVWQLDGEEIIRENRLLVEGSTASWSPEMDQETAQSDVAAVSLLLIAGDGYMTGDEVLIPVTPPDNGSDAPVRTEEITVTCIQDCSIYSDSRFLNDTGAIMYTGETGLLLAYDSGGEYALDSLHLQFADGSDGWVSARRNQITEEDCTTDVDYTRARKTQFVNDTGYESDTEYLVWVSLYTQKVNVFQGSQGDWTLIQSFDCASGANATPTTTGIFRLSTLSGRWNLSDGTYVEPVLVFNGGEGFTSQPKYSDGTVADDAIGSPVSGGSVRLLAEDIAWMAANLELNTTVVVY